jgi:hypothetical protein
MKLLLSIFLDIRGIKTRLMVFNLNYRFPKSGKLLFENVKNPWPIMKKRKIVNQTINNYEAMPYAGGKNSIFFQDFSLSNYFKFLKQKEPKSHCPSPKREQTHSNFTHFYIYRTSNAKERV